MESLNETLMNSVFLTPVAVTATGVSYGVAVNQDPIHIPRYAFEISFLGCFSVKFGKLARASCRT